MAETLFRLLQTSAYTKYKYRVPFCWWAAEKFGEEGSQDYVKQAKVSTVLGERSTSPVVYLNYDMIASSDVMFGIMRFHRLFIQVYSSSRIICRGISVALMIGLTIMHFTWWRILLLLVCTLAQIQLNRERYGKMLRQGRGRTVAAAFDPCYHKACDSMDKVVIAAAHTLARAARKDNLRGWLYSSDSTT